MVSVSVAHRDSSMVDPQPARLTVLWVAGMIAFAVLVTANGAGYRYGVSDQAFYIPAVIHAAIPGAFPRDAALIDSQAGLMMLDELLAWLMRTTGLSLDLLFFSAYLLSLALIWAGVLLIGSRVGTGPTTIWTTAALGAAVALRHRIPKTSANSLEPYFHPRMLAFGVGLLAVAALLHRRTWLAIALVGMAALVHITTALWFAILIGVALAILDPRMRLVVAIGAIGTAIVAAWAVTVGPLHGSTVRMDDVWLQAIASKDSLFPNEWPLWAWVGNLGVFVILVLAHRHRTSHGVATREDDALVWGATALVAVFLITLPAVAAHVAIAVQFQVSRVFWLIDFLATVYVIAAIAGSRTLKVRAATSEASQLHAARTFRVREKRAVILAALLIAVSISRGAYIIFIEHPERHLFELHLPQDPWDDAMRWLSRQPLGVGVLADPGHAWKYGASVRVTASRDVFMEEVKDSAIAMYARDVAVRVVERTRAVGDFTALTPERARELAAEYDLTYLVTEQPSSLPLAYRNSRFGIYRLR